MKNVITLIGLLFINDRGGWLNAFRKLRVAEFSLPSIDASTEALLSANMIDKVNIVFERLIENNFMHANV